MDLLTHNIVEDPDFANAQPVLRSGQATQALDPTAADLRRLVAKMDLQGIANFRAAVPTSPTSRGPLHSMVGRHARLPNQRKDAGAQTPLVNRDKSALLQNDLVLSKGANEKLGQVLGGDVLRANLHDARRGRSADRENRSEVQVVGEHDVRVVVGPGEDVAIRSPAVTYGRPVDCGESMALQCGYP